MKDHHCNLEQNCQIVSPTHTQHLQNIISAKHKLLQCFTRTKDSINMPKRFSWQIQPVPGQQIMQICQLVSYLYLHYSNRHHLIQLPNCRSFTNIWYYNEWIRQECSLFSEETAVRNIMASMQNIFITWISFFSQTIITNLQLYNDVVQTTGQFW